MSTQKLLLDRLEFTNIRVITNQRSKSIKRDKNFPQLDFDFDGVTFLTRSSLQYPPEEADDPRHFALTYGLKIDDEKNTRALPYEVEVEAIGFFRYLGDDEFKGADRFRAIRLSGYQILHGAIREMICNMTSRCSHGLWQLPARNFGEVARERAEQDESDRLDLLAKQTTKLTGTSEELPVVHPKAPRKRTRSKKGKSDVSE